MNSTPLTRALLTIASVIVILAGVRAAQTVVMPVLVAFFLAVLTSPMVTLLVRKVALPTSLAVGVVVVCLLGLLSGIGYLLGDSIEAFVNHFPNYENELNVWLNTLQTHFPWLVSDVRNSFSDFSPTEQTLAIVGSVFSGIGSVITATVLIVFTLIFTLMESQSAADKLKLTLGQNNKTLVYIKRFSKLSQRYLLVKSLVSLVTGLIIALSLWLLGVDYPILWGAIAFLMNFIPNIGSLIAAIPAVMLATLQLGLTGLAITSIVYIGVNMIVGNLIEPRLMGKTLDISPLVVFLSLVFWGFILGPVGMLLSIPLTVMIKIGLEVYPKTRWLAKVLSQ